MQYWCAIASRLLQETVVNSEEQGSTASGKCFAQPPADEPGSHWAVERVLDVHSTNAACSAVHNRPHHSSQAMLWRLSNHCNQRRERPSWKHHQPSTRIKSPLAQEMPGAAQTTPTQASRQKPLQCCLLQGRSCGWLDSPCAHPPVQITDTGSRLCSACTARQPNIHAPLLPCTGWRCRPAQQRVPGLAR
jgi:hypothetical protein